MKTMRYDNSRFILKVMFSDEKNPENIIIEDLRFGELPESS